MIQLTRSRKVDDVPAGLCADKRREKEIKLLRQAAGGGAFDDKFWNSIRPYWKPARGELFRQSEWKCAYCESLKEKEWEGDVEHFRPKSKYWWLACCYDNYLFACKTCNSEWKGDAFPIDGKPLTGPCCLAGMSDADLGPLVGTCTPDPLGHGDGMVMKAFRAACRAERARLLDPYSIDPEPFFRWVPRQEVRTADRKWIAIPPGGMPAAEKRWLVEIAPRNNRQRTILIFEAARDCYGLNRDSLQDSRGRFYETLLSLKSVVEKVDPAMIPDVWNEAANGLRRMMSARYPYAGMARYFVYDEWRLLKRE